eukprot:TRINITY_DN11028_c0_g2_i2.p1 TRINITY_DN11028_c0_g2~~TRINITY_DN11028_c0_g2_i2.p1  ORF type:complete len:157 (+),score=33.82 TRINITY_DN11028_c0_g2_i2:339-809(+)
MHELQKATHEKDKQILLLTTLLKRSDEKLSGLLDSAYSAEQSLSVAHRNPVNVEDLIVYSHKISKMMCEMPYQNRVHANHFLPCPQQCEIERTRLVSMDISFLLSSHIFQDGITQPLPPPDNEIVQFLTIQEEEKPVLPQKRDTKVSLFDDPDLDF